MNVNIKSNIIDVVDGTLEVSLQATTLNLAVRYTDDTKSDGTFEFTIPGGPYQKLTVKYTDISNYYVDSVLVTPIPSMSVLTNAFKVAMQSTVAISGSDISIGAVELKDSITDVRAKISPASASRLSSDNVILVQNIDSNGNVSVGNVAIATGSGTVGSGVQRMVLATDDPSVALLRTIPYSWGEVYVSPQDFTAYYSSPTSIVVSGSPFTVDDSNCFVFRVTYKSSGSGTWIPITNTHDGVNIVATSNVITVTGSGSPFNAGDTYRVVVLGQKKGYDSTIDAVKVAEVSPLSSRYVTDDYADTTNINSGSTYYPSSAGTSMDGYKNLSLTGKLIDADGTITAAVEATNDDDYTNGDWVQIYGFDTKNNMMTNILTTSSSSLTYAWDFDNFNYQYYRILVSASTATNTVIIKGRKTY